MRAAISERRRARDSAAEWNELVHRYAPYVHAVLVHAFRLPEEEAEDTFQAVFARTWEERGELGGDDALQPWIVRLTRELGQDAGDRLGADPPSAAVLERVDAALARQLAAGAAGGPSRERQRLIVAHPARAPSHRNREHRS